LRTCVPFLHTESRIRRRLNRSESAGRFEHGPEVIILGLAIIRRTKQAIIAGDGVRVVTAHQGHQVDTGHNPVLFARPLAMYQGNLAGIRFVQGGIVNHQQTARVIDKQFGLLPQRRGIRLEPLQKAVHGIMRGATRCVRLHTRGFGTRAPRRSIRPLVDQTERSALIDSQRFATSLRQDYGAVQAGLTLAWNSGQVEGQVNKLKLIKRMGHGRVQFDLLKQRMLAAELPVKNLRITESVRDPKANCRQSALRAASGRPCWLSIASSHDHDKR
jgi:hypothetical protein